MSHDYTWGMNAPPNLFVCFTAECFVHVFTSEDGTCPACEVKCGHRIVALEYQVKVEDDA